MKLDEFIAWFNVELLPKWPKLLPAAKEAEGGREARNRVLHAWHQALSGLNVEVLTRAVQAYFEGPKGKTSPSVHALKSYAADVVGKDRRFARRWKRTRDSNAESDEDLPPRERRERKRMVCLHEFVFARAPAPGERSRVLAYVELLARYAARGREGALRDLVAESFPVATQGGRKEFIFVLAEYAGVDKGEAGRLLALAKVPAAVELPDRFLYLGPKLLCQIGYVPARLVDDGTTLRREYDMAVAQAEAGAWPDEDAHEPEF